MKKVVISFFSHAIGISLYKSIKLVLNYKEKYQCRLDFICRYIGEGEDDSFYSRLLLSSNMRDTSVDIAKQIKKYYDLGYDDIGNFKIDFDGCFKYLKTFAVNAPTNALSRFILRIVVRYAKRKKEYWTKTL